MAKILVVEDNQEEAAVLALWLKHESYVVDVVHSAEDALQILSNYSYDVLILDWELPDMSGAALCKMFRERGGTAPILMLTGRSDATSKETGLDAGADDYLTKPYAVIEAAARLRALLRRPRTLLPPVLKIGNMELDVGKRAVNIKSQSVLLTKREVALLEYLMRHPNQFFGSKSLLDSVWPLESAMSEDTVRSCMRNLRKKLMDAGSGDIVQTMPGRGYGICTPDGGDQRG